MFGNVIRMEDIENKLVVKANKMVEAHYNLSLIHQKIILILASFCNPNLNYFEEVSFAVKDLMRLIGMDGENYNYMKKITKELNDKSIELIEKDGDDDDITQAPWMSYAKYKKGVIKLKLNDAIKPFILQLNGHFTKYRLASVIHLSSTYSIRIYELLMQYRKIGSRHFELTRLRGMLGISENKLVQWSDFRKRVIEPAQKELLDKTDIIFDYELSKKGKKVIGITFEIQTNCDRNERIASDLGINVQDIEQKNNESKSPYDNFSEKLGSDELTSYILSNLTKNDDADLKSVLQSEFNITGIETDKLIKLHTKEKLWEKYHYYHYKKSTTEIKNPTAWFINAVVKDYSTADMKQAKTINVDWSDFNPEESRLTDLKNELNLLNSILKEAQDNLASPVCEYSSALREQYHTQIKDTNAKITEIQKEIKELESHVN